MPDCSKISRKHTFLKVGEKHGALVALNLPVLDGTAPQDIVQFDRFDGCCSSFILRSILAQPEMDVPVPGPDGLLLANYQIQA